MFTRIMTIGFVTAVITIIQVVYFTFGIQYFMVDTSEVMDYFYGRSYEALKNHYDEMEFAAW